MHQQDASKCCLTTDTTLKSPQTTISMGKISMDMPIPKLVRTIAREKRIPLSTFTVIMLEREKTQQTLLAQLRKTRSARILLIPDGDIAGSRRLLSTKQWSRHAHRGGSRTRSHHSRDSSEDFWAEPCLRRFGRMKKDDPGTPRSPAGDWRRNRQNIQSG